MQMRVDSDDAVEAARDQRPDDLLADRLASMKRGVLPHVAEIGRDQDQRRAPFAPKRFSREQQCQQLVVRPVERRINDADADAGRQSRAVRHPGK